MVSIVGPDSSGKSTLLRRLARLQRPTRGRVLQAKPTSARLVRARLPANSPVSPVARWRADLTVRELVYRGRFPPPGHLAAPHSH
ncbi:MAG: ATP-binding cassette domain-containing protein [Dehalococcoidia bacterium]|nr:ATP-binding cassette domain-containing protein [Dehalococcoidia bacterium]